MGCMTSHRMFQAFSASASGDVSDKAIFTSICWDWLRVFSSCKYSHCVCILSGGKCLRTISVWTTMHWPHHYSSLCLWDLQVSLQILILSYGHLDSHTVFVVLAICKWHAPIWTFIACAVELTSPADAATRLYVDWVVHRIIVKQAAF